MFVQGISVIVHSYLLYVPEIYSKVFKYNKLCISLCVKFKGIFENNLVSAISNSFGGMENSSVV